MGVTVLFGVKHTLARACRSFTSPIDSRKPLDLVCLCGRRGERGTQPRGYRPFRDPWHLSSHALYKRLDHLAYGLPEIIQ